MNKLLGYYTVGNKEFFSKIQACIYATKTNQGIKWIFNDYEFSKFDWLTEPTESLDELYDNRARQLREKYDYIVISYSAGSDSHNVLMSFLRQGLHVDELIINTMSKINDKHTDLNINNKKAENFSAEHFLQTIPRLKEINKDFPNIKITIKDMSDNLIETMSTHNEGEWIFNRREVVNPMGTTRFNMQYITDLRKQFDKDRQVAVIFGIEKPRTLVYDNNFYIKFNDRPANFGVAEHIPDYNNVTVEYFYWHPDSLKMLSKQAHIIKKWVESNPQFKLLWSSLNPKNYLLVQERILRTLLYSTWNDNWYQADKPILEWRIEFANFFFKEFENTNILQGWKNGIELLKEEAKNFVFYTNDNQNVDGLIPFGKNYLIGRMK
jgi:hypothetical protein